MNLVRSQTIKHLVDGIPRSEYIQRPDQKLTRKLYRENHKEQMLDYYQAYRARHPNRTLWRAARDRAKRKGLEFTITYDDIKIPDICPVLGIPIVIHAGRGTRGGKMDSPSLDRINNTLGYTPDNVQVISHKANSMKFTATQEELLNFAKWINSTYGQTFSPA